MNDSTCPYCGAIAEKPYSKKRKCKECGKYVYYSRRYPFIYNRHVLGLNEVKLLDFYHTITALLGIEDKETAYKSMQEVLMKKWGVAKPFDVVWSIANNAYKLIKFEDDELDSDQYRWGKRFDIFSSIDLARARFMPYYDNRHTPKPYLQNRLHHNLEKLKLNKESEIAIYAGRCCQACMVNDGTKLSLTEAENTKLIPYDNCDNKLPDINLPVCTCEFISGGDYAFVKGLS